MSYIIMFFITAVIFYFFCFRKHPEFFKEKKNIVVLCISIPGAIVLHIIIRCLPEGLQTPALYAMSIVCLVFLKMKPARQKTTHEAMAAFPNAGKSILRKYIELQAQRNKLIGQYSEQTDENFFPHSPQFC